MTWNAAAITARWPGLTTHTNVPTATELAAIATVNISTFLVDVGSAYDASNATHLELLGWYAMREILIWYQQQQDFSESMANNAGSTSLPTLRECNWQIKAYKLKSRSEEKRFHYRS